MWIFFKNRSYYYFNPEKILPPADYSVHFVLYSINIASEEKSPYYSSLETTISRDFDLIRSLSVMDICARDSSSLIQLAKQIMT